MLGKWLERLTPEQEDRLLTQVLVPFVDQRPEGGGCLIGVAYSGTYSIWDWSLRVGTIPVASPRTGYFFTSPAARFNQLCQRLAQVPRLERLDYSRYTGSPAQLEGGARAAVLIRNRILRNRATRALAGVAPHPQLEGSVRA